MDPALGEPTSRRSGQAALALRLLQNETRIRANAFVDIVECCLLRAPAVFRGGANDPAGIRNEVGNDHHSARVQGRFRIQRAWNVCALCNQLGLEAIDIVRADDIRPRCGNPDVARNIKDRLCIELLTPIVLAQRLAAVLQSNQCSNIQAS